MCMKGCSAGCTMVYGGEIRHDKGCQFYKDSYTEIYDGIKEENIKLKRENAFLRQALLELSGECYSYFREAGGRVDQILQMVSSLLGEKPAEEKKP